MEERLKQKKYDDFMLELEEKFGGLEHSVIFLLVSICNLTKHIAKKTTPEEFTEIMQKDEIAGNGVFYATRFREMLNVILKGRHEHHRH